MNQTDEVLRTAAIDALRNAARQTAAEAAITDLGFAHYANGLPDFGMWVRMVTEDIVESDYKGSLPDFHKVYEKASRRRQVSQVLPLNANSLPVWRRQRRLDRSQLHLQVLQTALCSCWRSSTLTLDLIRSRRTSRPWLAHLRWTGCAVRPT